jgi:glycosyltransferase involved in cell wall biosynthesis
MDSPHTFVLFKNTEDQLIDKNERVEEIFVGADHYSIREQTKFLKILTGAKLDLMHFTHFNAPLLHKCKSVVTIHDLTIHFFPGKKMNSLLHRSAYKLVMKSVCKKAEKVIAVSKNTKNDIVEQLRVPEDKIEVIYEAAGDEFQPISDSAKLETIKSKYGVTKPLILYTGNWRTHKNLTRLIEAFYILTKAKGFEAQLMITGEKDSKYAPAVMRAVEKFGVAEDIIFPGIVPEEDLVSMYNLAHVYVFPSLYEGFGLPPLEAMQCGTVTCVSNVSSVPEVCGHENAFFFNPYDVSDMTETLYESCTDKMKRTQVRNNGLERVKKFSWEKTAKETMGVYNKLFL